ncbi:iron-sulfur cluster assembly scaffold protein [Ureaplasma urealyticum]|uniref:Iron-sulfur cluster assembly scaffold protein n=2 Tax=Ureaplasma urealyticum TaxID=2130 RepID=A0AAP9D7H7_UREUR|nr:iron-sulfur cluster assembly scaffold protein [Ureaplasma urealyticum]EDX53740.1 nitrogen fixation protein NifU [Ureaplasma urealyticum serovar 9 str. ATCC 33175]EDU06226.1 nitrogen fixation protein NifU [Ureaplasma urealyticum serovar 5 str. ATCC 27817]EDU57203.1 nitrogen fixation protein NifU [Ureaplasma urealyticum serovar 7 str. ATCC 27819]EDU67210.1 nitrogen fixation protein NifU [Ureaplasma urealyticum serovar 11 str. ATCC 33695]EDX53170.1 nitrogen fixation protein NifU [Ureaplasma ur
MASYNINDNLTLRSIIMKHYERPKNKVCFVQNETDYLSCHNTTEGCSDDITVYVKLVNQKIVDVVFLGTGCAISTSSTDIICELVKNQDLQQALELINNYLNMIQGLEYNQDIMQELIAFHNVKNQMNRIRCARIGINALKTCLEQYKQ